ncbi:carboxylate--amine ligase [Lactococcus allomyrinae]|uniref:Carboxylate--amine ligase n=1 Tax=Lactococcus allomyrinae TaxID=2419773 RepID=A0A387BGF0_9LACT|nr:carboxylate--amine ligase [Lactococcus allomyrinae]AYG01354.1 carboxylate--amine ligase [Lactococcus allomyrinae]
MSQNIEFQPILLGSDINVYGMARSFHEEFGITSIALSASQLAPTKYSKIVEVQCHPHFDQEEVFIKTLREFKENHANDKKKYLLVACGDGYALMASKYKAELSEFFEVPYIDYSLYQKLENKPDFYNICEEYQLPYPKTVLVTPETEIDSLVNGLSFPYPMILKPGNSISYLEVHFEGQKKAFTIASPDEMKLMLHRCYEAGYPDEMIIQDFIPGTDENMRVLNAYVDKNHKVRMMCLGHPLLEDPSPKAIGNYVAILPDYNEKVYQQIQDFLEKIEYTGFANFDMKYDPRDGEYKLFEINLRQGRSSFYVTLNGYNLTRYLVADRIFNEPFAETVYGKGTKLWLGVPKKVLLTYVNSSFKAEIRQFIKSKNYGTTLFYAKDNSPKRYLLMKYAFYRYTGTFKEYFNNR